MNLIDFQLLVSRLGSGEQKPELTSADWHLVEILKRCNHQSVLMNLHRKHGGYFQPTVNHVLKFVEKFKVAEQEVSQEIRDKKERIPPEEFVERVRERTVWECSSVGRAIPF